MTTSSPVRTIHLSKRFAAAAVVSDLNMDVPEGSVFALIGSNGAGKTTALKMILNIVRPTSGRAEVLGNDSQHLTPAHLASIGYVSENQELPDWMTVKYFLNYCKQFYPDWDDHEAGELVRSYELPLERTLRTLSRGMRVKAALAAALSYRPKLIVLDEPFNGLDVWVREQLIQTVLERTPECTVVLASHDLAEIESFASHVAYIDEGHLRFTEEMTELNQRFREVEVTTGNEIGKIGELPEHWLHPEYSSVVLRFVDSRFDPERTESEVRRRFPDVQSISNRGMSLRAIFVALARPRRSDGGEQ